MNSRDSSAENLRKMAFMEESKTFGKHKLKLMMKSKAKRLIRKNNKYYTDRE
jgi:hypothetical protein